VLSNGTPCGPRGIGTIPLAERPYAVAITPDGSTALVTRLIQSDVVFIDVQTRTPIGSVAVGEDPVAVAVTPDGTTAITADINGESITFVDVTSRTVVGSIPAPGDPWDVAITPDGTLAIVPTGGSDVDNLLFVDVAMRTIVDSLTVGSYVWAVAITPDGATALVTDRDADVVHVVDLASRTVVTSIPVGTRPARIDVTPDGATAFVANFVSADVSVIDIATRTVVDTIPIDGIDVWAVAVTTDDTTVFVISQDPTEPVGQVISVNVQSRAVINTLTAGNRPRGIAVTPSGRVAWIAQEHGNEVTVVTECTDEDGDGAFYESACGAVSDCNDASATIAPDATEVCDGYDNDCDGAIDSSVQCAGTCDLPDDSPQDTGVTNSPQTAGFPTAFWNGAEYGVAWTDTRNGTQDVYFARLTSTGARVGPDVRISTEPGAAVPSIVWTGLEYGIVWRTLRANASPLKDVYFARVGADGTLLQSERRLTESPASFAPSPTVVWTGSEYGVAWLDQRSGDLQTYFARLDARGEPIGVHIQLTERTSGERPALVWTGSSYALLWAKYDPVTFYGGTWLSRFDLQGRKLAPDQHITTTSTVSMAWNGTGYGVAACDSSVGGTTRFLRLAADGGVLGDTTVIASSSCSVSLAWTGSEYAIAFAAGQPTAALVLRLDVDGTRIGAVLRVSDGDSNAAPRSLVWSGSEYAVVWDELRDGDQEVYFDRIRCACPDADSDGISTCNDCEDLNPAIYPGATQLCDGLNNDCNDPTWPIVPVNETNADGDAFRICHGDCDDTRANVHPGAPELCDGLDNDCANGVPSIEADADGDTYRVCSGDCDETNPARHPDALETCNAVDDNCNALVDEDGLGEDTDSDGIHNLCDNCPQLANPTQLDTDADAVGNSCDNCSFAANPAQQDADADARGDACDNCRLDYNPLQDDYDGDAAGDACDNCLFDYNPQQTDMDDDIEGDLCDLDDGLIYILFHQPDYVEWQEETGFTSWNSYRGDLAVLRGGGPYTQLPGSNTLASRQCGLLDPWTFDDDDPAPGKAAFYLTTGVFGGESGLGPDSAGNVRPNANPCP